MTRPAWGALLAAALPASQLACASPPPPAPPPPAPSGPPVVTVAPSPPDEPEPFKPDGPPGLTQLVVLAPGPNGESRNVPFEVTTVTFGKGYFTFANASTHWNQTTPPCPLVGDGGCGLFRIAPFAKTPGRAPHLAPSAPEPGAFTVPRRAPRDWVAFSGGAEVVYAFRAGDSLVVDTIDEQGNVKPFVEAPASDTPSAPQQLVETSKGPIIVGGDSDLWFAPVQTDAQGKRAFGKAVQLPIRPVPQWRQSAQGARMVESDGGRAMWGPYRALPVLDDAGKPTSQWQLVWVEVSAPPFSWPTNKPFRPRKGAISLEKHGCGGPSSRPLNVPSVEKMLHITRFDGATLVEDVRPGALDKFSAYDRVVIGLTDRGVWFNGATYDAKGRPVHADKMPPAATGAPSFSDLSVDSAQRILTAAFDASAGRGIVLFSRNDGDQTIISQEIDANGAVIGSQQTHPRFVNHYSASSLQLGYTGREWLASDSSAQLRPLSGERKDSIELPARVSALAILPRDSNHVQLVIGSGYSMQRTLVDTESGAVLPLFVPQGRSMRPLGAFAGTPNGLPPFVIGVSDSTPLSPQTAHYVPLEMGRSPVALPLPDQATIGDLATISAHAVFNDAVVHYRGTKASALYWVRAARMVVLPKPLPPYNIDRNRGPLAGHFILPDEPGEPIVLPDAAQIFARCPNVMTAGKRKLLLTCVEAVDESGRPSPHVGTRLLRY